MKQYSCTPPPSPPPPPPFMLTFIIKGKVKVKLTLQHATKAER
jgi:hypothetical protein